MDQRFSQARRLAEADNWNNPISVQLYLNELKRSPVKSSDKITILDPICPLKTSGDPLWGGGASWKDSDHAKVVAKLGAIQNLDSHRVIINLSSFVNLDLNNAVFVYTYVNP